MFNSSRFEKSLNSVNVLETWKVLEFHYFVDAAPFTVQLDSFAKEKFGLSSMYEPAQQNNAIYFCASDDNVCKSFIPMAEDEVKIVNDSFKEGQKKA